MKSIILYMFILQAIINGVNLSVAMSLRKDRHVCRGGGFKSDTIRKNRDLALDKLVVLLKHTPMFHDFHHTQAGDKPEEQVSASLLCPLSIDNTRCECAFNKTVQYLLSSCPEQNEGVAWDIYSSFTIMVRYSAGRKIFSVLDDWAWYSFPYPENVNAIALEKTMDSLTSKLKEEAATGDALHKYATGTMNYDGFENSFVAVQCTPDISREDCIKCLSKASNEIRSCCTRKLLFQGRAVSTNCYIWYSHVSFFHVSERFLEEYCDYS